MKKIKFIAMMQRSIKTNTITVLFEKRLADAFSKQRK